MTHLNISRRHFLITTAAAGGGMILGLFSAPANAAVINERPWMPPTDKEGIEINQWVIIDATGLVTVVQPHAEMGQGALTSVAMMLNEELQADWNKIRAYPDGGAIRAPGSPDCAVRPQPPCRNVANLSVKFLHAIGGLNPTNATANPPTLQSRPTQTQKPLPIRGRECESLASGASLAAAGWGCPLGGRLG